MPDTRTPTPEEIDDRLDLAWSHPEHPDATDADVDGLTEYTELDDGQVHLDPAEYAEHPAEGNEA